MNQQSEEILERIAKSLEKIADQIDPGDGNNFYEQIHMAVSGGIVWGHEQVIHKELIKQPEPAAKKTKFIRQPFWRRFRYAMTGRWK